MILEYFLDYLPNETLGFNGIHTQKKKKIIANLFHRLEQRKGMAQ